MRSGANVAIVLEMMATLDRGSEHSMIPQV